MKGRLRGFVLWSAAPYRAAHTQLLRDSLCDPRTRDSKQAEGVKKEAAALRRRPGVSLANFSHFFVCGRRSKASGPLHPLRPQPW